MVKVETENIHIKNNSTGKKSNEATTAPRILTWAGKMLHSKFIRMAVATAVASYATYSLWDRKYEHYEVLRRHIFNRSEDLYIPLYKIGIKDDAETTESHQAEIDMLQKEENEVNSLLSGTTIPMGITDDNAKINTEVLTDSQLETMSIDPNANLGTNHFDKNSEGEALIDDNGNSNSDLLAGSQNKRVVNMPDIPVSTIPVELMDRNTKINADVEPILNDSNDYVTTINSGIPPQGNGEQVDLKIIKKIFSNDVSEDGENTPVRNYYRK